MIILKIIRIDCTNTIQCTLIQCSPLRQELQEQAVFLISNYLGDQDDISKSLINGNFKRMAIKRPSSYINELPIKPDFTIKGKAIILMYFLISTTKLNNNLIPLLDEFWSSN